MFLISTIALTSTVGYLSHILFNSESNEVCSKFNKLMDNLKIRNEKDQTFTVLKTIKKSYGYDFIVGIPIGLSYSKLQSVLPDIKDTLCADIIMNKAKSSNSAYLRIATDLNNKDVSMTEKIRFKWHKIMDGANIKNHLGDTFKVNRVVENDFGYCMEIYIPEGLTYTKFNDLIPTIQDNLNSKIVAHKNGNSIQLQILNINSSIPMSYIDIVKLKWHELCMILNIKNSDGEVVYLKNIMETNYGFKGDVITPIGFTYDNIIKHKESLQESLKCRIIIYKDGNQNIHIKASTKGLQEKLDIQDTLIFQWDEIMEATGIKTKNNNSFNINTIEQTNYGYCFQLDIPNGIELDLKKLHNILDVSLKAYTKIKWDRFNKKLIIKVATKDIDLNTRYKPIPCKPYEICFGIDFFNDPIIVNQNSKSHTILAGSTGSGKSRLLFIITTNIIVNTSPDEAELYLMQISDKKDVAKFKDVKHCRYYATNLISTLEMLNYLHKIMEVRSEIISRYDLDNIEEFNHKFPNSKWSYMYLINDETTAIMPDETDSKEEKKDKEKCLALLKKIAARGRSSGVFFIGGLQRPCHENFPVTMKNNINNRLSLMVPNDATSLTILDTTEATELTDREFILISGAERYQSKSMYIDNAIINKYISPYKEKKHKYINLNEINVKDPSKKQNSIESETSNTKVKVQRSRNNQKKKSGDLHVIPDEN